MALLNQGNIPMHQILNLLSFFCFSLFFSAEVKFTIVIVCLLASFREQQLELKKWEVKQAEKQRVVKLSAAEWADHPDRYLLELGGRQTYNTPSN